MDLATLLVQVDDVLYTWLLIYLLAGSGIYFSIRTRFVQIRRFKDAMNCMMEKKEGEREANPFARMTEPQKEHVVAEEKDEGKQTSDQE